MLISIRTKRIKLSPYMRRNIEAFLNRVFDREKRQIERLVVAIGPAKLNRHLRAFTCRIRLWSSFLGLVTVNDVGGTIRTAVQQASLRARQVARHQLHKRRSHRSRFRVHLSS